MHVSVCSNSGAPPLLLLPSVKIWPRACALLAYPFSLLHFSVAQSLREWSQNYIAKVQVLALPFISCVILVKLHNLSCLFPHIYWG